MAITPSNPNIAVGDVGSDRRLYIARDCLLTYNAL
jgi:hypothetical protein